MHYVGKGSEEVWNGFMGMCFTCQVVKGWAGMDVSCFSFFHIHPLPFSFWVVVLPRIHTAIVALAIWVHPLPVPPGQLVTKATTMPPSSPVLP